MFRQGGALVIVATALVLATTPAGLAQRQPAASSSAPDRFTVMSDGHPMAVWSRRPATPKGVILLVHGRTWSSRPDFDLQVSGLQRSVLASFVSQGFAAYAVDLRGRGRFIKSVEFWYEKANWGSTRPTVSLYGR